MAQKILMCKPTYFSIAYEINPWMNSSNQVEKEVAIKQWMNLEKTYKELGAEVLNIDPNKRVPDLVFTANAGLVYKNIFFPSNFRFPERQLEQPLFIKWFKDNGYKVIKLPKNIIFEGAGDALFCGDKLYLGSGFRSDRNVEDFLVNYIKDFKIITLGLSNPYFYHLDTCFSPLPDGQFIYYPDAFDDESRIILERYDGNEISEELCINYGCNLTYVGKVLVTGFSDNSLRKIANKNGLEIKQLEMNEYIKSGGGTRCLSLFL